MIHLLAGDGGYQEFTLRNVDKLWLVFSGVTALAAIAVGFSLMRGVLAADEGTPKMIEDGVNPDILLKGGYGHQLHIWDLPKRRHRWN